MNIYEIKSQKIISKTTWQKKKKWFGDLKLHFGLKVQLHHEGSDSYLIPPPPPILMSCHVRHGCDGKIKEFML